MPTVHIESKRDEIADIVLMPGDPNRSEYIAKKYLKDYEIIEIQFKNLDFDIQVSEEKAFQQAKEQMKEVDSSTLFVSKSIYIASISNGVNLQLSGILKPQRHSYCSILFLNVL